MWHSTWGRWTTSRICDPSGKDSPSNSQWAEECSARRVLSHRPFHLQFPGCNLWILDYWCLLASDLPSSYVWTPGLSRLPHPAVLLLLWMLHVFNFPLVYKLWSTILRIFLSSFFFPPLLLNFPFVPSFWATIKYPKRLWESQLVPWYSGGRTKTQRLIFTYREVWSLLCFSCPSSLKRGQSYWATKRQGNILVAVFSVEDPMPWVVLDCDNPLPVLWAYLQV